MAVTFGANAPILLGLSGYVLLALDTGPLGAGRDALLGYLVLATLLSIGVTAPLAWRWHKPLARVERSLDEGKATEEIDAGDARTTLLLYRPLALVMLLEWLFFSMGTTVLIRSFGVAPALSPYLWNIAVACVAMSIVGGVICFYAYQEFIARRVGSRLLHAGYVDHLQPFTPLRTFHHLSLLFLVLGVCMPAAALVLVGGGVGPYAGPFFLSLLFVLGALQALGLLSAISGNVGNLAARMAEVRKGRLDVKARVRSLDIFGLLASDFNRMVEGLKQRELLRETFGRYVTQQVADAIIAGRVELGGEERTVTVLFADIRGFTSMSEEMEATEVVAFLNRYLDNMVDCVFKHGGILDKFIGDAIMAVFGVPVGSGDEVTDAEGAVACALEMQTRLEEMNLARRAAGEVPIEIGIGIHTGPVLAGNIGSPKRMEYTVIGDTVNLTSRIEGLTKETGRRILVSGTTAGLVEGRFAFAKVAEAPVRGRSAPVQLYTIEPVAKSTSSPAAEDAAKV